jgi:hypothetical protein
VVNGGIIVTGGENSVGITSKGPSVTLRHLIPANAEPGDTLELDFMSNCAVSLTAGPGETPVFGKPVVVRPDLENRRIYLPLGAEVSGGVITIVIDLVQPGRVYLSRPVLRRARSN